MADQEENFNLIPVEEKDGKQLVDGRELHRFLQIKKDFATWLKRNLNKAHFVEGEDFSTFMGESIGGRKPIEAVFTLDMAKHLCLLSKSERGFEARQYFIEVEKKYNIGADQFKLLVDKVAALERMLEAPTDKQKRLQDQLKLPEAKEEPEQPSYRAMIVQRLRTYTREADLEHFVVWGKLYQEMYYRYGINLRAKAKKRNIKPIDVLAEDDMLEEAWNLSCELFKM